MADDATEDEMIEQQRGLRLKAIAEISDSLAMALEVAIGHRAQCLQAGFSEDHADQIGLLVHAQLLNSLFQGTSPSASSGSA